MGGRGLEHVNADQVAGSISPLTIVLEITVKRTHYRSLKAVFYPGERLHPSGTDGHMEVLYWATEIKKTQGISEDDSVSVSYVKDTILWCFDALSDGDSSR